MKTRVIFIKYIPKNKEYEITIDLSKTILDLKKEISMLLNIKLPDCLMIKKKARNNRITLPNNDNMILADCHIYNGDTIIIGRCDVVGGGGEKIDMEINIQFIKISKDKIFPSNKKELKGLLKLCLLKEISYKLPLDKINSLSKEISWILTILKNGYIVFDNPKDGIINILQKYKGSNIISFSKYVDEIITFNETINLLDKLSSDEKKEITNISNFLENYSEHIGLFDKDLERAKKDSIFEYSIISLAIIERENFDIFSKEREKCPNRFDKILFHGTGIDAISSILPTMFRRSEYSGYQHGKGVYFTEDLDYCWFYGGEKDNRANKNIIPRIGECFTLIASSIYYDKNGFKRVYDYKYTPKTNEINFAYAGSKFETIKDQIPDKTKFLGTEFVIYDFNQICPFISAKLKRDEYCVIWRDNNFSSKPVYNNNFDSIFKEFLKERMKYIRQTAKFNIYPCETSEEALNLVKRKKFNKIILISNVGGDLGGQKFIIEARKIIGNDVITLFSAYNTAHLNWIKKFKNSLFSNEANFYEEYLNCFLNNNENSTITAIKELKQKIEKKFGIEFYFDSKFLYYPNFKDSGHFSDLTFDR